ncbi:MAG: VOC family protein [Defluviitaleaceae bacterium]|nr:VOC family protein [Defluviitaleaceae bacterium]
MVKGISHITFIVKDLQRASLFFTKIFGAKEVYSSSTIKYFLINDLWIALNIGEPLLERTYNHIAFQVQEDEIDSYITCIKEVGAEIRPDRPNRKAGEGRSVYFYDFDGHLFELHTGTLSERLAHYLITNQERG